MGLKAWSILFSKIEDCDVFIGIFWTRFGTPVKDALSGTEHEFRRAYESWERRRNPQILFYFSDKPYRLHTEEEVDQLRRVLKFKREFPAEGLWWSYRNPAEFKDIARRHLTKLMTGTVATRKLAGSYDVVIPAIIRVVAEHFKIPEKVLTLAKDNSRRIVVPRRIAMYMAKELTDASLPEIGRHLGKKHHTIVMHYIANVAQSRKYDAEINALINQLMDQVLKQ